MPTYLTQGLILKKNYYKDCDSEYTIYTQDFGKIKAIAKSAKKITSKLSSHLEPFFIVNLMIAQGLNIKRLAGAQIIRTHRNSWRSWQKILLLNYFFEVLDILTLYDLKDEFIFDLAENFLNEIEKSEKLENGLMSLNCHIFNLLKHLGYQPKISARSQKELFLELKQVVVTAGEKEVKSFRFLAGIFGL